VIRFVAVGDLMVDVTVGEGSLGQDRDLSRRLRAERRQLGR
jgi:hypothetical protein